MTAAAVPHRRCLADVDVAEMAAALAGKGLWLDVGLATVRVRSSVGAMAPQLRSVYRNFSYQDHADWADLHVDLLRPTGLRRWLRPQVRFRSDGQEPFDPFPASAPLPMFEWGANWCMGRRLNDVLLMHAGVVERDGRVLVMPALPGSGKSTLTAALSLRGWRLLSDEFGAVDLDQGLFHAVLKPVGLKNDSIKVIRRFAPDAPLGPEFPKTRKGTVAHLAPSRHAVDRVHEAALPGAILFPSWRAGSPTLLEPAPAAMAFSALAFNAFNYAVMGREGFQAVVRLVQQCPAWKLVYSDLDDALSVIDREWPGVLQAHSARRRPDLQAQVASA